MFVIENDRLKEIHAAKFSELKIKERADLQRWIRDNPSCLCDGTDDEELLIIQEEFDGFDNTNERLDLLAIDTNGDLVIIENKTDDSGKNVTWQALKYASYCSTLSKQDIIEIYEKYLEKNDVANGKDQIIDAEKKLNEFLSDVEDDDAGEKIWNKRQRIILVARSFRKEVTSTVLWLRERKIDIRCVEVTPYSVGEKTILNFDLVIPVIEMEDYQIRVAERMDEEDRARAEAEKKIEMIRMDFWHEVLKQFSGVSSQFKNVHAGRNHWISHGSGISGVEFNFVATNKYASVSVYMQRAAKDENKCIYDKLLGLRPSLEEQFGSELQWERLNERKACRISYRKDGVDIRDRNSWQEMIGFYCEFMPKLEKVFKDEIIRIGKSLKYPK